MNTFQVNDGDFVLSNGAFAMVTGTDKIQQDLGIAINTPYGSDRFHARFGSTMENFIGQPAGPTSSMLLKSEVTRVVSNYQAVQTANSNSYIAKGLNSPYSQNDLVQSLNSVTVTQDYDTFEVAAVLTTQAGQSTVISATVSPNSVTTGS